MKKRNLICVIAVVTALTVGFMIGRVSTQKKLQEDDQRHYTNWFLIGLEFEQYTFQQEDDQKWNKVLDEAFYLLNKENLSFEEELDFLEKLAEFNLEMENPSANEM